MNKVTISIALYNNLQYTKQCLGALFTNTPPIYDLVIVDNGSTDGTRDWLTALSKRKDIPVPVTILINSENMNFAGAHNQAFEHCKTDYFLLLNNDTIPMKDWLEPMIEAMEANEDVKVVGSKLISPIYTGVQHAGVVFREDCTPTHINLGKPIYDNDVNNGGRCPSVTGACMMIDSEIYRILKGLEEEYKNGWEDTSFNLKVRQMGYSIWYEPKSVLWHYEGKTEGRLTNETPNRKLFMARWGDEIFKWGNKDIHKERK